MRKFNCDRHWPKKLLNLQILSLHSDPRVKGARWTWTAYCMWMSECMRHESYAGQSAAARSCQQCWEGYIAMLLAFWSKGHRFQSPPRPELRTISECQSVSGTSLTLVRSAAVRPCQQCREGYIAMVLCHTLSYSLWLIYQSEMCGFDISILSLAFTMKASGKLWYPVSSSAEIYSQASSSVVKRLAFRSKSQRCESPEIQVSNL